MSRGDNLGQNGQKSFTPIIVAAIGAVAVIVAAIIGVIANRSPSNPHNSNSPILDPTPTPTWIFHRGDGRVP